MVPKDTLARLAFPHNIGAYLSNLAGLGLVVVKEDAWLFDPKFYEPIESNVREPLLRAVAQAPNLAGRSLELKRGLAQRTSFGLSFIRACHE